MLRPILRRIKAAMAILADGFYDARRYFTHSQSGRTELNPDQLRGRLLQKSHSIEKGLSMPNPRDFFGIAALREIEKLIAMYERQGLDENHVSIQMARGSIRAYFERHAGKEIPANIKPFERLAAPDVLADNVGTIALTREGQIAAIQAGFESTMRSRRSLRMFAPDPIDPKDVEAAIELAGSTTPSVCNRQSCRAYVMYQGQKMEDALALQGGNRGFGQLLQAVVVVTSDVSNFRNSDERNQGFVDGGLFSMSLLLALHAKGLGAVSLNWSAGRKKNEKLIAMLDLPNTDLVIMMIGIGQMPEEFEVAASPRRNVAEILREVGNE